MSRLFLLGDGEVVDLLAELSRYLEYREIHRGDQPSEALGPDDHVVIDALTAPLRNALLARVLDAGDPGYLGIVAAESEAMVSLLQLSARRIAKARLDRITAPAGHDSGARSPGEQAIAIAAQLIAARRQRR